MLERQPCFPDPHRPFVDAIVVWDWVIALPREYRFVSISPIYFHHVRHRRRRQLLDLEDGLDPGQDGVPALPVSTHTNVVSH